MVTSNRNNVITTARRAARSRTASTSLLFVFTAVLACACPDAQAQYLGGSPRHPVAATVALEASSDEMKTLIATPRPPMVIGVGDGVEVQVYEIEHYDYKTRIGSDGRISLPLANTVILKGTTPEQAESLIAERLQTLGMVKDPHVHITVIEQPSQTYSVVGEVNKPGLYPALGEHTMLSALAEAGGLRDTASSDVTLLRAGESRGYTLNLGNDPASAAASAIPIYTGDRVVVGAVGVVYVVGAVKMSGVFKLKTSSPTTVLQAVTMAGGPGFEAERKHVQIVRTLNGGRVQIPIDMKRIVQGKDEDPVLQADDIVLVPSNSMRAALKSNGAGLAVSLATSAMYRF